MYDVIVIGCGSGGYAAAIRVSQLGGKVAVVESADIGGTCVNRGCIPSKVWHEAAGIIRNIRRGELFGIKVGPPELDLKAIVERKNGVANDIRMGMQGLLGNYGVDLIQGKAVLKSSAEIDVDGTIHRARQFIIATGSQLHLPDIPGLTEALLTSDDLLEMDTVPESVLVVGAGFIEIEMANILQTLGAQVTLATESERLLPREDHDTSQRLTQILRESGITLHLRAPLEAVEKQTGGFQCALGGAGEKGVQVARVLVASRRPLVTGLGLEQVGVALNDDGGIQVNDFVETSVPGIYAIGDCTGGWMLSHQASGMAVVAAENTMGRKSTFSFNRVPRGSWTWPEVGSVGLSEEAAEKAGYDIEIGNFPYAINGLAMCRDEMQGSVKIIADEKFGDILGVHIVGSHATELIGEAALAMQLECTAAEYGRGIRNHPSFSEAIVDAARDVEGWALYLPKA